MPVLASAITPPSAPPPPGAPPPSAIRVTYIDPDGNTWEWSDRSSGAFVTSVAGIGAAPSALAALQLPTGDVVVQGVTPGARSIVIGLYAWDDDQGALLARADALARALTHDRAGLFAAGTLIFQRPDGSARQIAVACTSGADVPDDDGGALQRSLTLGLTFQALAPYFQDPPEQAPPPTVITPPPSGAGVPPMPPIILTPETALGDTTITNSGDADAWPAWTISGPGTPTLANLTTGRSFAFATALTTGQQRIVTTQPGLQSAIDGSGTDWWADLVKSSPRDLWQLVPGVNELSLVLAGAGTGSQIKLSYARRWRRA
jgi:hypothetical protein